MNKYGPREAVTCPRLHNKWQKPELRSFSSDLNLCVLIKMLFCVYL